MNAWDLPTSLEISGVFWKIRTDYRAIIDIMNFMSDPEYETDEKWLICLDILYEEFDKMPSSLYKEACEKAKDFIDMGIGDDDTKKHPKLMDWEQDAPLIIPAINKVLNMEIRAVEYMHWWSFMSAYMEIGECSFSHILQLRQKRAKGEKLESWEKKFISENKNLVNLKRKLSESEKEDERIEKEILSKFI